MNGMKKPAALAAAAAMFVASHTSAQSTYPVKPVRIVVPSSAGGGTDIIARIVAPKLTQALGQQVVIDNRPGAGTMIGGELVAKAPPDGYTLLMCVSTLATNPVIYRKVPYNALTDFAPITRVLTASNVLVVHPSLPPRTVKELIAFAKARPGQINFGSAGLGTNPHLSMELFLSMTGLKMVHVPYKGSAPAIIDLLAGHVVVMTATALTGIPHIRAGRLRALGVTGAQRTTAAADIPTIAEAGVPGYEALQWYGMVAPANTPREVITRLNREMVTILQAPDVKEKFAADGADPAGTTPEEFGRYIRSETEKWQKVAQAAAITPE
jgi:tripartite-type tricarboxylate transporter receptor subunit TctC